MGGGHQVQVEANKMVTGTCSPGRQERQCLSVPSATCEEKKKKNENDCIYVNHFKFLYLVRDLRKFSFSPLKLIEELNMHISCSNIWVRRKHRVPPAITHEWTADATSWRVSSDNRHNCLSTYRLNPHFLTHVLHTLSFNSLSTSISHIVEQCGIDRSINISFGNKCLNSFQSWSWGKSQNNGLINFGLTF